MSQTNGSAVLDRVRAALAAAHAAGEPTPGRPTLVKQTGASDYQVRKALAKLQAEPANDVGPDEPAGDQPDDEPTSPTPAPASSPARRHPRPWPLLLIGLAAAVAVWSGWVGLAQLAGFGVIQLLPGIWDDLRLNTAVVLPISVEAYAAYALRVWLGSETSARTTQFAKWSAIASLVIGAGAQVAYHLMSAAGFTTAPWWMVMLVAIVPVVVLGLASALAKLVASDATAGSRP